MVKVYSVFPACGKTWIFANQDKYGICVLDSDSSQFSWCMRKRTHEEAASFINKEFTRGKRDVRLSDIEKVHSEVLRLRNPEFPGNYVNHIKEKISEDAYDCLFVSSHEEVRTALREAGIPYTLVYPHYGCLAEWVGRCYMRQLNGTNGFPIKVLVENWQTWIDQCDADPGATARLRLEHGQFLSDVLPECKEKH